jgi:polyisoprenoid-binding protein YceI
MVRILAIAVLASAFSLSAAAQVPGVDTTPADAHGGTYSVEPAHTRVLFSINHMGFSTYYGNFTGVSGTLKLDPKKPAESSVSVSIPTGSVSTTNTVLDGELKAADWFDAAKYPAITFKSTKVTPTGHGTAKIAGELTLHGVTKPVVLTAKFNAGGVNPLDHAYTVGFDATTTLKRSAYGVSKYVPLVGDEVTVTISAAFEQK